MPLYTYGGNAAAVLTDAAGNVIPDYPLIVRVAGTGQPITALYEADGTTPIGELRSNPAGSDSPGAIRPFKIDGITAIEYEYNGLTGPVRWFESGREVPAEALEAARGALSRSAGGTVNGPVTFAGGITVRNGFTVHGEGHVDTLDVDSLTVDGKPVGGGSGGGALPGMFAPQTYGAKADGVADDAPAVQAALDAAHNAGGGWVLVPPGNYRCATLPLRIRRGTRLTLMKGATFTRGAPNTFLLNGDANQNFGGYGGHGDIVVEGGVWDMRAPDNPTDPDMCISIGHARNVVIRDLEIRDVGGYHAIELNSAKNGLVENCRFLGYLDTGGRDFSEAVQLDGAFRSSVFGGFGPYDGTPVEDVVMRDCYVGASGTPGTVAWPAGVGSHSAAWGIWHRRIKITGCTFEGGAQYAVKPYIWDDSVISGNTVAGMGAGVWARTLDSSKAADRKDMSGVDHNASQISAGLVVADNVFRNIGSFNDAVFVEGEATGKYRNVTITGNTVATVGGTENGIRAVHVERFTATGNTFTDIGGTALSTEQCADGVLSGNHITTCGSSFFTSNGGARLTVADNNASDCKSHGFWAWSNTDLKMTGNYLRGAGRGDSTAQGIRLSTGGDRITITNNTYRRWGSGTEAASVYTCTSAPTNIRRWGNDWLGQGTVVSTAANENLSPYDAGTP
ncbi:right-handed parallel beta-helix repeat-containing protein [Streptomyces indicus]|uniref:Right handed beta helix region n=1 Tax=Streptomyces indicus TaxID=417292 RepID=A0A1G9K1G9_9ACTN|nr:right-handed parallel beta-helix repeat-containing protein [Streptomyces indicus]SDL43224.1 Right handed beta helix region [Streptomyces indicus]